MGNTAVTIHHPTSLDHGIPQVEYGKMMPPTSSMIHLSASGASPWSCGGRVVFRKNVLTSGWHHRFTREDRALFEIGKEVKIDPDDVVKKRQSWHGTVGTGAKLLSSIADISENLAAVTNHVSDDNSYSELYFHYNTSPLNDECTTCYWLKNDLGLKKAERWYANNAYKEFIVDIIVPVPTEDYYWDMN